MHVAQRSIPCVAQVSMKVAQRGIPCVTQLYMLPRVCMNAIRPNPSHPPPPHTTAGSWYDSMTIVIIQKKDIKIWHTLTGRRINGLLKTRLLGSPPVRWGLLDFMSAVPPPRSASSSASSAGPQLQALDRSVPRRTSTASSGSECSPPKKYQIECQKECQKICPMHMPERMSERMSEHMPERMPEWMP